MKTIIYKYPLAVQGIQTLEMPKDAKILTIQTQRDTPCLWAEITKPYEVALKSFIIVGTGHEVNKKPNTQHNYIGTFQLNNGDLVFHCYEVCNDSDA